jgi:hypothetical protein
MMSDRQVAFVAFDVDRIKEFVFATHRPMDATGASELIKRLDQEELPSRFLQGFSEVQIVYARGGGGLLKVGSGAEAEQLCQALEQRFRTDTHTGSVTAVWHPAPAGTGLREDTSKAQAFQDAFLRLGIKLRQRKAEKAGQEPSAPWEHSYLPRCEACAVQPALKPSTIGSDDAEIEWLCISCHQKRDVGRKARDKDHTARTMEEIALDSRQRPRRGGSTERGRVAVLYADVDRAGGLMQKCANETEAAVLSKHLWNATSTGSAYAKAQFPYRYQSPIVGGDDLLLFLPNRRCVHTLWEIWTQVEERLKSPPPALQKTVVGKALEQEVSLSIGMLVADHHLPIPFLFETARTLLTSAKQGSYKQGCSCLDFLTLDGGTPLSDSLETTRRTSLERTFDNDHHFPVYETLSLVRRMRLTRKPYTRQEFAVLLQDVEAAQRDADLQAALRSVARFLEKDQPLEAFINIGYQQARHPVLQRANTAHLYRVEPRSGEDPPSVTTSVFDWLELVEMEREQRESRRA